MTASVSAFSVNYDVHSRRGWRPTVRCLTIDRVACSCEGSRKLLIMDYVIVSVQPWGMGAFVFRRRTMCISRVTAMTMVMVMVMEVGYFRGAASRLIRPNLRSGKLKFKRMYRYYMSKSDRRKWVWWRPAKNKFPLGRWSHCGGGGCSPNRLLLANSFVDVKRVP